MKFKWLGTATLLVESGGSRILIDPYLKSLNRKLPRVPLEEARDVQAIFITHPHFDHFSDVDAFSAGRETPVYVPEKGIGHAERNGLDAARMLPLRAGETYRAGSLSVRAYRGKHCVFDAATILRIVFSLRTWLHFKQGVFLLKMMKRYKITDDICALEISDGEKTVMALGSAGMAEGAGYPKGADLLVFPYQGRTRMHRYIRDFLDAFEPKAVTVDHFDNAFPPFTHRMSTKKFVPAVKKRLPSARAFVPKENEWYEV